MSDKGFLRAVAEGIWNVIEKLNIIENKLKL